MQLLEKKAVIEENTTAENKACKSKAEIINHLTAVHMVKAYIRAH